MNNNDFRQTFYHLPVQPYTYRIIFKSTAQRRSEIFHKYPKTTKGSCDKFSFSNRYLTIYINKRRERIPRKYIHRVIIRQDVSVNVREFEWVETI
jgi:hypothetical protein